VTDSPLPKSLDTDGLTENIFTLAMPQPSHIRRNFPRGLEGVGIAIAVLLALLTTLGVIFGLRSLIMRRWNKTAEERRARDRSGEAGTTV
jgi:hypothetical protein